MDSRQDLTFRAALAEKAGRYDEVMDAMNQVALLDMGLTAEERNLLSMGFKKVTIAKRTSLHTLSCIELEEEEERNESHVKMTIEFRHKVEDELDKLCNNEGRLLSLPAEFKMYPEISRVIDESLKAYENASNIAEGDLSPAHPIRLGVALNVSVFYYEILNSPERACELAQEAYDDAVPNLELLDEQLYNKSTRILQILTNNLSLWNLNLSMDIDAEPTQDCTRGSGASGHSNMDVDAEYTMECKGNSGTSSDTAPCDEDAK